MIQRRARTICFTLISLRVFQSNGVESLAHKPGQPLCRKALIRLQGGQHPGLADRRTKGSGLCPSPLERGQEIGRGVHRNQVDVVFTYRASGVFDLRLWGGEASE